MSSTRLPWIVGIALALAFTVGLLIARRVMPAAPQLPAGEQAITSGEGVKIQFSDKPVPLPAMTLRDLDGNAISPASWRGKVVLLNFWATWCGPCREEIPALVALQDRYRDHLVVVGLSIDTGPPANVKSYVTSVGVNYKIGRKIDELAHL
jgi:thiol-disulfide isomerase/thioredoxin